MSEHYTNEKDVQPWDIVKVIQIKGEKEFLKSYFFGNVLKYLYRAGNKENTTMQDDFSKAFTCVHELQRLNVKQRDLVFNNEIIELFVEGLIESHATFPPLKKELLALLFDADLSKLALKLTLAGAQIAASPEYYKVESFSLLDLMATMPNNHKTTSIPFYWGNIGKYLLRMGKKEQNASLKIDAKKAQTYLKKMQEIENAEEFIVINESEGLKFKDAIDAFPVQNKECLHSLIDSDYAKLSQQLGIIL